MDQLAALSAGTVVVRQDKAGQQQKKGDRGVAVVDNRRKRPEPAGIGEVKKNDIGRGKSAQTGQGGQSVAAGSGGGRGRRRIVAGGQQGGLLLPDRVAGCPWNRLGQPVTSEPIFSPAMTRRMLPGPFMLKMIIGMLLSLHRLTAVISITFKPNRIISV